MPRVKPGLSKFTFSGGPMRNSKAACVDNATKVTKKIKPGVEGRPLPDLKGGQTYKGG